MQRILLISAQSSDETWLTQWLEADYELLYTNELPLSIPKDVDLVILVPVTSAYEAWSTFKLRFRQPLLLLLNKEPDHRDGLPDTDYVLRWDLNKSYLFHLMEYLHQRHHWVKEINRLSERDALTGLVNRQGFFDRLQAGLEHLTSSSHDLGVLLLNIRNLGAVNKHHGLLGGDRLLQVVAHRIHAVLPRDAVFARIDGDEFALLFPQGNAHITLSICSREIIQAFNLPFMVQGREIEVNCAMGAALAPANGKNLDDVVLHARQALEESRSCKQTQCTLYSDKETPAAQLAQQERELRFALKRNELVLYYQPQVELETGKLVGTEALIRWKHPTRGLLGPDAIIPLAESTGLIVPIAYWTFYRACQDVQELLAQGLELKVGVNFSFQQVQDVPFVSTILRILKKSAVDPKYLELELTETALLNDPKLISDKLNVLAKAGLHISLDDFGTGYSSFSHIQQFPVSTLKIDRSFIESYPNQPDDEAIVNSTIKLAQRLGMKVIAEGVEQRSQLEALQEQGCNWVQGYYYSRPTPLAELVAFARRLDNETDVDDQACAEN